LQAAPPRRAPLRSDSPRPNLGPNLGYSSPVALDLGRLALLGAALCVALGGALGGLLRALCGGGEE